MTSWGFAFIYYQGFTRFQQASTGESLIIDNSVVLNFFNYNKSGLKG